MFLCMLKLSRLVPGTVGHGGMGNSETVFLQLATGEGGRYKMLSVMIPVAVWRQIAGTAEPGSFKGKVFEVQTTPKVVDGNYVNIDDLGRRAASRRRCAVNKRWQLNKARIARLTANHVARAHATPRLWLQARQGRASSIHAIT